MTTRYVGARGRPGAAYDDPAHPAPGIAEALRVARAGDVIEVLDAATYREPQLVLDRPLVLTSRHLAQHPTFDPCDPAADLRALPKVVAAGPHRVLRIQAPAAERATFGPVAVRGLRIAGGRALQADRSDVGLGAGGGVLVLDADRVTLERCVVEGNRTERAPLGPWPEPDRLALRRALVDLAGEIFTPTLQRVVDALVAAYNRGAKLVGGPRLTPFERAVVLAEVASGFDRRLPPGRPDAWLAGQAFGGGVATVWASPTLRRCLVRDNVAEGRGAGIAVVGYGWPTVASCHVLGNASGESGRRDGGGVGLEVGLPGRLGRDLTEAALVRFLVPRIDGMRQVLADPARAVDLGDLLDLGRWLADPSSHPGFRGAKAAVLDVLAGRSPVASLLYYAATTALSRHRWSAWHEREIDQARRRSVTITGGRLASNRCADDGGGLYGSVLSRVAVDGCVVEDNRAPGMGGGVRLSMGSDGTFRRTTVRGNHAGGKGGGIAVRNVVLDCGEITVSGNHCADAPGGGVAVEVVSEGALAGIPDLWTSILREVFGVHDVRITVAGGSIARNGAGFDPSGAPLPRPQAAKGGGLYLLVGSFADAPSVELRVAAAARVIAGNTARTRGYVSKVAPGKVVPTADERCLQDLRRSEEWTEANDHSLVRGGDLRFSS